MIPTRLLELLNQGEERTFTSTVTISVGEYDHLRRIRDEAKAIITAVNQELLAVRQEDPSGRLQAALAMLANATRVARFAVANLPPNITRGWPWEALRDLGDAIKESPLLAPQDRETGMVFSEQARVIEDLERARALAGAAVKAQSSVGRPTGKLCSICNEPQLYTATGVTCENSHDDAPSAEPIALPPSHEIK